MEPALKDCVASFSRVFAVAPMMDCTDRHARQLLRTLSRHALLYTEMVTTGALLHGDVSRHLAFDVAQHPVALQLGGSDPAELARCARMAEDWGYDEINLNCGCPSDRVQYGHFGACLMAQPGRVAQCVRALKQATWLPVTVKARIGIDHLDSYDDLCRFVEPVARAGCEVFIIHARKAWLRGLSPKQNREIPPLRYGVVRRLKAEYPHLSVVINGGIQCLDEAKAQLRHVDGVMLGRAAYRDPYLLSEVDQRLYGASRTPVSRHEAVEAMYPYIRRELSRGTPLMAIVRHMLGLFQGVRGAKAFRRHLSENGPRAGAGLSVLQEALAKVPAEPAENRPAVGQAALAG